MNWFINESINQLIDLFRDPIFLTKCEFVEKNKLAESQLYFAIIEQYWYKLLCYELVNSAITISLKTFGRPTVQLFSTLSLRTLTNEAEWTLDPPRLRWRSWSRTNFGPSQTTKPPGQKPLVVCQRVVVGSSKEEEKEIWIAREIVKVKSGNPATPGSLKRNRPEGEEARWRSISWERVTRLGPPLMKPQDHNGSPILLLWV